MNSAIQSHNYRSNLISTSTSLFVDESEPLNSVACTSPCTSSIQSNSTKQAKRRCWNAITVFNTVTSVCIVIILLLHIRAQKRTILAYDSVEQASSTDDFCNRCKNYRTCSSLEGCICLEGYYGTHCEGNTYCDAFPCRNGGTCEANSTHAKCNCAKGYFGNHCQGNYCESFPCYNGGTCEAFSTNAKCNCAMGFFGAQCQDEISNLLNNYCLHIKCENDGICLRVVGDFLCMCTIGYYGRRCEHHVGNSSTFPGETMNKLIGSSFHLSGGYQKCFNTTVTSDRLHDDSTSDPLHQDLRTLRFSNSIDVGNRRINTHNASMYVYDEPNAMLVINQPGRYFVYVQIAVENRKESKRVEYTVRKYSKDRNVPESEVMRCYARVDQGGPDKQVLFCSMSAVLTLPNDDLRIVNQADANNCAYVTSITFPELTYWGLIYLGS